MMTNRRSSASTAHQASRQPRLRWLGCSALSLGLLLGCTANIEGTQHGDGPGPSNTAGSTGSTSGGGNGAPDGNLIPADGSEDLGTVVTDPNAAGPMPLRGLTSREYLQTVSELLTDQSLTETDVPTEQTSPTFDYFPFRVPNGVGTVEAEALQYSAEKLAANVLGKLSTILPCTPSDAGQETSCATQFINAFGARAYRRPLQTDEVTRLQELYQTGRTTLKLDFNQAIGLLVEGIAQSPNFYYQAVKDIAQPVVDANGKVALGPYTVANRLSYFLWGAMPDQALLDAARDNQLSTDAQIEAQARRMLQSDKARLMAGDFVDDLLDMDMLGDRPKNPDKYGMYPALQEPMRLEVQTFGSNVLLGGTGTFEQFLTSTTTSVDQALAAVYGVGGVTGNDFKSVTLSSSQRGGVLSLVGFLANTGNSEGSLPPRRGRVVFTRFLCTELHPPNVPVPEPAPEQPNITTRQRFEQHSMNPCATGCHNILDPLGFSFEHYDGIGAYRDTDQGAPVNSSTSFAFDGKPAQTFANALELERALAGSDQAQGCFTKQWLRYAFRRLETSGDLASLQGAYKQFKASGNDTKELLVALVKSRTFRFRTPGTNEVL